MRFDLRDGCMPLLTTKRVFWRGVVEELLWFIRGSTDAAALSARNVRIWEPHGSRAHLDAVGLHENEVGDLGPVYGFQWRHFGATYRTKDDDYAGQGIDQLARVVDGIRTDPTSRRHLMCAWDPSSLDKMALPPCHVLCQFYVDTHRGELSCQMYQRSADIGLGVPFNIASYALLTHMIAHVCDLHPGEFVHTIGDAHAYQNHVAALREQLTRRPYASPRISFRRSCEDIDAFETADIILEDYTCHGKLPMQMAV